MTMYSMHPGIFDATLRPTNLFATTANWFDFLTFGIAVAGALSFCAYLLRCYVQEFCRRRRLRRRQQLARATCDPRQFRDLCPRPPHTLRELRETADKQIQPVLTK